MAADAPGLPPLDEGLPFIKLEYPEERFLRGSQDGVRDNAYVESNLEQRLGRGYQQHRYELRRTAARESGYGEQKRRKVAGPDPIQDYAREDAREQINGGGDPTWLYVLPVDCYVGVAMSCSGVLKPQVLRHRLVGSLVSQAARL